MVKPKKKRPADDNQLAASILRDAVKLTEKPKTGKGRKR